MMSKENYGMNFTTVSRSVALLFALLVCMLTSFSVSHANQPVGEVLLIKGLVTSESGGSTTELAKGSQVFEQDILTTADNGYLVVKMVDDTKITLRPSSTITIEQFNNNAGQEAATIGLLKGGLRAITGGIAKIKPESFQVSTPTTTIGIRGTDFVARLCEDGADSTQCTSQCSLEESRLSEFQRIASKPETNGAELQTRNDCKPITGIENGLYVGLYDGQLNLDSSGNEIDIQSLMAARVVDTSPECLVDVPNFLSMDPYLGRYAENAIDLINTSDINDMTARVKRLLDAGFSPEVIYNHEVSRGNALYNVVDAAIVADPVREPEFRWLADQALGGLPDTACGCTNFEQEREWKEISYDALEPKTVAEAARAYFEDGFHLSRLIENSSHGLFPVQELMELIQEQELWYRVLPVRNHPLAPGVFVSIYEDEEQVIVDGNLGMVLGAFARGDEYMPVIFQYYPTGTIPINRYPENMTSDQVNEILDSDNIWVSPPPDWLSGDFHAYMTFDELANISEIPEKEDIDPELWDTLYADLSVNGFLLPVIISRDGTWAIEVFNSVEKIAVARELGITLIPVAIFEPPPFSANASSCRRLIRDEFQDYSAVFALGNAGGPSPPDEPPRPPAGGTTPPVSP